MKQFFLKVSEVLKEVRLKWEDCVGVCSDRAATMLGKNVGFHAKVKSLNSGPITYTQCIIHQKALTTKKISAELCVVLLDAVKIINYIKSCTLNSRFFPIYVKKWIQSLDLFCSIQK